MRRLILAPALLPLPAAAETILRVMSFNAWGGGANEGKGAEKTVAALPSPTPPSWARTGRAATSW